MSRDMVYETVPRLNRRVGDMAIASENNSTLLLGRDRISSTDTGYGGEPQTGAAHLIVGRGDVDPDPDFDAATIYLSSKSDPDDLALSVYNMPGPRSEGKSVAFVRADCMRLMPRDDFKLVVGRAYITVESDGTIIIDGDISLGKGAAEKVLRESFARDIYPSHTHLCAGSGSPSGPPLQPVPPSVYADRVKC